MRIGAKSKRPVCPQIQLCWKYRRLGFIEVATVFFALGASISLGTRPATAQSCIGDCDGKGAVAINDLVRGVAIALGNVPVDQCTALDANSDGMVKINELLTAVNNALGTCDPVVRIVGACERPGSGRGGLAPCDNGTTIRAYSCAARNNDCVQGGSRQVLTTDAVYGGQGQWGLAIPSAGPPAGTLFAFEADVDNGVVFRTLDFGVIGALGVRASAAAGVAAPRVIRISPVTEASVRLIEGNRLENFSNDEIAAVITAVDHATANVSFADLSPADAASFATQVAAQDPMVMMVIKNAVPTATPTGTPTSTPSTPTSTVTLTPTMSTGSQTVFFGETLAGAISAPSAADTYQFTASAGDLINLVMVRTSGTLRPEVKVFDQTATGVCPAASADCVRGSASTEITSCTLTAGGTYTVFVHDGCDHTATGDYNLYLQRLNAPAGTTPISYAAPISDAISGTALKDAYTFAARAGAVVDVTMTRTAGGVRPEITVYDSRGARVCSASADCVRGSASAEITSCTLTAGGTYLMLVDDGCGHTNTGTFDLTLTCLTPSCSP